MKTRNPLPRFCALLLCAAALAPLAALAADKDNSIEVTGKLETGIMAIGGETTGTTLTTPDGKVYELDLQKDEKLTKLADELKNKDVTVKGTLRTVKGVERGERKIITLTALAAAIAKQTGG